MTNAVELELLPELQLRFLERCPDLGGKVDAALASKFKLVRYERDHTLYTFEDSIEDWPLRVIMLGHVSLVQRRGREQVTRSCGPMSTFGEESVKDWNDARMGGAPLVLETVNAITKSVTHVLELARADFADALGPPGGDDDSLLARLLGAYDVHDIASDLVQALGLRPELVEVDNEGLYQMLEGAEIRHVEAGEMLAAAGVVPTEYFVLVERGNSFELRTPGKDAGKYDVSTVPAPACTGIAYVIRGQPLEAAIHVQREGRVVVLSDRAFWELFKFNTDFQRAIIRSNDLGVRGRAGAKPRVDPSDASIFLMAPALGLDLPMRALTDLLAESIVTHLYDNVLVVHAVPKPAAGEATTARPRSRSPEVGGPWLEHMWIEIDRSLVQGLLEARTRYLAEMDDDHGRPDVTLIEISELHDLTKTVQDFDEIDTPFKVIHLTSQPDSVPPIAFIAAGASILYTGILDEAPPVLGVGAAAHLAHAIGTPSPAAKGAKATIDAALTTAKNVATFAGRMVQGFKDARSIALGNLPPAWPLGTVRIRLPAALRAALAARAGRSPTRLADLGSELAEQTRPTLERWARAVTTRRVGLALGGGGTYGDVHVPLIMALAKERVPIDMVSGSSVGSTIGAYYCGLDLQGLDLYWDHRSLLLVAGSVGFVSSAAVEVAMTYDLGQLQLAQTEIPFFPVVTDADVGVESYLSKGTFAFGVRASGSLPPLLGPTVQGDRRYLDGGLVANVPVNVLAAEGAALIIASNPIARLSHRPRQQPLDLPLFGVLLRESNPRTRLQDAARMVPMIFGVAGQSQAANADVMYRPASTEAGLTLSHDPHFISTALESVLLKKAVAQAVNKWRASLGHPPPRVRIVPVPGGGRALEVQGWLGFVGMSTTIDPASVPLLVEVADYLVEHPEVLSVQVVVSSADRAGATRQAERVKALLEEHGVQPARVAAIGAAAPKPVVVAGKPATAPEPELTFPVVGYEEAREEQTKLRAALAEAKRARLDAERRADGETLTLGAKDQATSGDLDLAGLLAIEAAKLTRSPSVDEVLRLVLGRRGMMERSITIPAAQEARCAAWSPDGALLAVGSRDGLLRIWDAATTQPEPLATIDHSGGTDKAILGVAFSTDGSRIAAAGLDGQASVHEVSRRPDRSLELKAIFQRDVGTWDQWGVALSPDGGRVLVTWRDRTDLAIFAVDSTSSPPLCELHHASNVAQAAWEPEGERVAAAMSDGTVVIWSATGAALETITTGERTDARVAWHPRGGVLAVACEATATIHDLRVAPAHRSEPIPLEGHRRSIVGLAWSNDGSLLVTTSKDMTARIWQAATGAFQMSLRSMRGHFVGAAFRPGSVKIVATWDELGAIAVWNAETGEARTTLLGHKGSIKDARWSPDGARLATTSTDATARIWAPEAIGQVAYLGHADSRKARVIAAAFSPSGADQMVTGGIDGSARAWRASDGHALAELASASTDAGPASVSFSPDGKLIAVTQARVAVPLLFAASDLHTAIPLAKPPATNEAFTADPQQIRWSPDGSRLAVKRRSSIVVWSAASGAIERVIAQPRDVVSFCWSPAGDRLALSLWIAGAAVEIWDATGDGPARARLDGFEDGVWSVDWRVDADGKQRLATGCNRGRARVHDADTGALLASIDHVSAVKVVALSPDGRWLATGDDTKTVAIRDWARAGAASVSTTSTHRSRIRQLMWSADGRRLVSLSEEDGVACLWERRDAGGATSFVNVGALQSAHCAYDVVGMSPDATKLVTGDDDGCALIHPVTQEDLVAAVARRLSRSTLTDPEWTRYLPGRKPAVAAKPSADPAKS